MEAVERRTLLNTGVLKLEVVENEKSTEVAKLYYPNYPYGNLVKTAVALDRERKLLSAYTVRHGWNGTEREDHGCVELSDEEFGEVAELLRSVKAVEDFEKLVEKFRELRAERERAAEREFGELVKEARELARSDKRLRTIRGLKKRIREVVESLAFDP
ncbi:MAG: hypothetical protein QW794_01685 [Thermosphaera sp.]